MQVKPLGDHWVIDDGGMQLMLCPCCMLQFKTQEAAVRTMDTFADKGAFEDAVEIQRLFFQFQVT